MSTSLRELVMSCHIRKVSVFPSQAELLQALEQPANTMSPEEIESLQETRYLLKSPNNAIRLLDAVAEIASGYALPREVGP